MVKSTKPKPTRTKSTKPKSARSSTRKTKAKPDPVQEKVDVEVTPESAEASAESVTEAVVIEESPLIDVQAEPTEAEAEVKADVTENPEPFEPSIEPVVQAEPVHAGGGFVPSLMGGIVALAIAGAFAFITLQAGYWTLTAQNDVSELVADQAKEIAALQSELALLKSETQGLSGIQTRLEELGSSLSLSSEGIANNTDSIAALSEQLANSESQPIPEAELPAAVVNAYEAKLADLNARIDEKFATVQQELDAKLEKIEAVDQAAASAQEAALQTAAQASADAALARIQTAMQTGAGFASELEEIAAFAGLDPTSALKNASESGVATLDDLKTEFPDLAREALASATRAAAEAGEVSAVTAFFRTQLGTRSLTPQDGDDADAVLSRAEDAVGRGQLSRALAELLTLPEVAQDILRPWMDKAISRATAEEDLSELVAAMAAQKG